jgi:RNA polymerase sigma-70 factor (ECF subfamily)
VAASGYDAPADEWMASYRAPLVGFVLPLVNGDLQAAEDAVQETMLRGWQHAAELTPEHTRSWLHSVARNVAISDYHRRSRARPSEVPFDEGALPTVDGGLAGIVNALLITSALSSLSTEHQAVIVELFYQRRTVTEVATLLAIPEGTVRSRCFYALRSLRRTLEGQGITE